MAAEHETASQAAIWAAPALMLLGMLGAAFEWARRELKGIRERWDAKALALDMRINELASGHIHDHDAWKLEVDHQLRGVEGELNAKVSALDSEFATTLKAHETHDVERFNVVHRRLDEVYSDMATREDVGRVEAKTDKILVMLAEANQHRRN